MRRFITNKILLGVLCIIIGLIPLLTIVNVIGSGKAMLAKEFNKNGSRLISVKFNGASVKYGDFKELKQQMPELKAIIPISRNVTQLSSYKSESSVELKAVGYDYWKLCSLNIIKGKFLSKGHESNAENVIVIDDLTADKLFGTTEVLGRSVNVNLNGTDTEADIIGVSKKTELSGDKLEEDQGLAFIPISMLDYNSDTYNINEAMFLVNLHVEEAKARLIHYFDSMGIDEAQLDISYVTQVDSIKSFIDDNLKLFIAAGILWLLAAIIGLINIMLVDIERNRKYYGLLKFYGNSGKQIRRIVIFNALIIGFVSSAFSIILGLIASFIVCNVFNIPIFISVHTLTLGILLPGIICLAAAIYPAIRTAGIDMDKVIWQHD